MEKVDRITYHKEKLILCKQTPFKTMHFQMTQEHSPMYRIRLIANTAEWPCGLVIKNTNHEARLPAFQSGLLSLTL